MKRTAVVTLMTMMLLWAFVPPTRAQSPDLVTPVRPLPILPDDRPAPPVAVEVVRHEVNVTVREQVAAYAVTLQLSNPSPRDVEADFVMPLPGEGAVTSLSLWVDGRRVEAQLLPADEALQTYNEIVRQRLDPALLEYAGQGALRARVFPISARGSVKIEFLFTQVLTADAGLVGLAYPFETSLLTAPEIEIALNAQLESSQGIGTVYSPTHDIQVQHDGTEATVSMSATGTGSHFQLYYGSAHTRLSSAILSYRRADEDGYLMLLLASAKPAEPQGVISRDVIIVLDTSGSMRGEKLAQAKEAASYVLEHLNEGDRFGLISFNSGVYPFAEQLQGQQAIPEALRHIRSLPAEGGTHIDGALQAAVAFASRGRPQVILFLTDGLPTLGEVSVEKILSNLEEQAGDQVQLFTFGVGYDVNTLLLDQAALDHHGTSTYVRPEEDIEQRVSSLYDKINLPVLTDVKVALEGISAYDIHPLPLPDLFAGEQLIIVGRYRQPGTFDVVIEGQRDGAVQRQTIKNLSVVKEGGQDFVPSVWAARKVGMLLTGIRLRGENPELVEEVTLLAEQYGIVTPYTSLLADELDDLFPLNAPMLEGPVALQDYGQKMGSVAPMASNAGVGAAAVERSLAEQALRENERPVKAGQRRIIAGKTFVLTNGVWIDNDWTDELTCEIVALGSARYLALLQQHPDWGRWLALGPRVQFVYEGQAYQFTD